MSVSELQFQRVAQKPESAGAQSERRRDVVVPQRARVQHPAPDRDTAASETISGRIREALDNVFGMVAPVWPLHDFVAVNPYQGLSDRAFLSARHLLRSVSDCEMLPSMSYFAERVASGKITAADIGAALGELHTGSNQPRYTAEDILNAVRQASDNDAAERNDQRSLKTLAEWVDSQCATGWSAIVRDLVGAHCAAHYDTGQATWSSPWKELTLYQAWRQASQVSLRPETLGISDFRALVGELPHSPEAAIAVMLDELSVPEDLWEPFLLSQIFSIPGWFSWVKYRAAQSDAAGELDDDLSGLLAMRLALDCGVSRSSAFQIDWTSVRAIWRRYTASGQTGSERDVRVRSVLQQAGEIAYRRGLLQTLSTHSQTAPESTSGGRPSSPQTSASSRLAQMVFCIDVRSERLRRCIESVSEHVDTFGFAGFFGVPMAWQQDEHTCHAPHVPALLTPEFSVSERPPDPDRPQRQSVVLRQKLTRGGSRAWKQFQKSAMGCFSFVESSGLLYGWQLWRRTVVGSRTDAVPHREAIPASPEADSVSLSHERRVEIAAAILRGIGLDRNLAPLVVLCGHRSTTTNNPLQASLDCGACGGHSGEPNARFAAALLNLPSVRAGLREQGVDVPETTVFVAGVHDTTSDQVLLFPDPHLSQPLRTRIAELTTVLSTAQQLCVTERLPELQASSPRDLMRRMRDWSEVRPEWGLAGNAGFIVGPRSKTRGLSLNGRAFLHSYDAESDGDGTLLTQIMTAPMVVAHWINMQYYASSVDPDTFGSGSKTTQNIVGNFGLLRGNGGDLQTGLSWQSVHNGTHLQHEPLRLLSVIYAPRSRVAQVISSNPQLEHLVANEWMTLVVCDGDSFWRLRGKDEWVPALLPGSPADNTQPAGTQHVVCSS